MKLLPGYLMLGLLAFYLTGCGGCGGKDDKDTPGVDALDPQGLIKEESALGLAEADLSELNTIMEFVVGFDLGEKEAGFAAGEGSLALPRDLVAAHTDPAVQLAIFYVNSDIENKLGTKVTKFEFANLIRFKDVADDDAPLNLGDAKVNSALNDKLILLLTDTTKMEALMPGWTGPSGVGKYAIYKTTADPLGFIAGKTLYCSAYDDADECSTSEAIGGAMVTSSASPFVAFSTADGAYAMPNTPGSATISSFHKTNELYGELAVTALSSDETKNVMKVEGDAGETAPIVDAANIFTDADTGAKSLINRDVFMDPAPLAPDTAPQSTQFSILADGTTVTDLDETPVGPTGTITVQITFDKALDEASVTPSTFFVRDVVTGTSLDLAPTITDGKTVTIALTDLLANSTAYEAVATSAITGAGGDTVSPYDADFKSAGSPIAQTILAFTTAPAPTVNAETATPANGTVYDASGGTAAVTATVPFNGTIDSASFVYGDGTSNASANITLTCSGTDVDVSGDAAYDADTETLTVGPLDLAQDQTCTFWVGNTVTDVFGAALLADFQTTFITGTTPMIVSTTPASNAVDVAIDSTVSLTFGDDVDGITAGALTTDATGITFTVDTTATGTTFVFTPSADWPLDTAVTLTLGAAGITDNGSSTAMDEDFSFTFQTEKAPVVEMIELVSTSDAVITSPWQLDPATIKHAKITFSRDVDAATITDITLATGDTSVAATAAATGNVVTMTPDAALTGPADFLLTVPTTVTDTRGSGIAAANTFTFSTIKVDPSRPGDQILISLDFEDYDTTAESHAAQLGADGWQTKGHVKVVNGWAEGNNYDASSDTYTDNGDVTLTPYEGLFPNNSEQQFLYLSTGKAHGGKLSSAQITVDVPTDASTMVVSYNFISAEYKEWIGTIYNDLFTVKVAGETGFIVNETVNQSEWFGISEGDDKNISIVVGGINDSSLRDFGIDTGEFDGQIGKKFYKSGSDPADKLKCMEGHFDISAYAGKTVTLILTVSDAGDSIYDSAALIDYIDFRKEAVDTLRQVASE